MSVRAQQHHATVLGRERLADHLLRLRLGGEGLAGFASTGMPDEWVGLVVPGQFQSRYYTVRSWDGSELVLDIVVHEHGLVTEWAQTDCVGDAVTISDPKGSFVLPDDAAWLVLVGDLTALPAIARIRENVTLPTQAWVESGDGPIEGYDVDTTWIDAPEGESRLADFVATIEWPAGDGYFWMAGESAQMRDIRRHVRRDLGWGSARHDLMGYWSGSRGRQTRAVDPGPIYARGKAAGLSDEQIWAEYDEARGND